MATVQTFEVTSIFDKYNVLRICASWTHTQNGLLNSVNYYCVIPTDLTVHNGTHEGKQVPSSFQNILLH
jgi:hypothetical protein